MHLQKTKQGTENVWWLVWENSVLCCIINFSSAGRNLKSFSFKKFLTSFSSIENCWCVSKVKRNNQSFRYRRVVCSVFRRLVVFIWLKFLLLHAQCLCHSRVTFVELFNFDCVVGKCSEYQSLEPLSPWRNA